jgi:hypothetical protein
MGIYNTVLQVYQIYSLCSYNNPGPILPLLVEPILSRGIYPGKNGRWTLFLCLLAGLKCYIGPSGYLHQVGSVLSILTGKVIESN